MRVLLLKTGSTVPPLIPRRGDFDDWFREGLGVTGTDIHTIEPHRGDPLPAIRDVPAVVVTGSPSMVTDDAPWSLACEHWLADCTHRGVPILAVCYGHHLLARGLGGRVGGNPRGREIGTTSVKLTAGGRGCALFAGLPDDLTVQVSHCQSVLEPPPGAQRLAHNDHDPFQAMAFGARAFGVQFHPEFDADIIRGYIGARREDIEGEGLDGVRLQQSCRDSDHGRRILANFVGMV